MLVDHSSFSIRPMLFSSSLYFRLRMVFKHDVCDFPCHLIIASIVCSNLVELNPYVSYVTWGPLP